MITVLSIALLAVCLIAVPAAYMIGRWHEQDHQVETGPLPLRGGDVSTSAAPPIPPGEALLRSAILEFDRSNAEMDELRDKFVAALEAGYEAGYWEGTAPMSWPEPCTPRRHWWQRRNR